MTVVADRQISETPPAPAQQPDRVTVPPIPEVDSDEPRAIGVRSTDSSASLVGSALAGISLTWVIYEHILGWSGVLGFIVCCWALFIAFFVGVSAIGNPGPVVRERLASAVVSSGAAVVFAALMTVIVYIFVKGWPALHHTNFYTTDMTGVRPTDSLDHGGILHAIVGSGIEIGIAAAISLPLGLGTAVYLTEVGGRFAAPVRTVVEAMTALPDILAGLFVYTVLIIGLHWDHTGFAVALALAITMIPYVARSAEVVLRVVPGGLREAAMALGASRWQSVRRVVLPTAKSGLATSLILGIARIAGETAPLLIVSGASSYFNKNPFHNPMNSLPLFIFSAVRSGEPQYIARGYGASALLLTLVLILFVATRILARDRVAKSSRRVPVALPPQPLSASDS